MSTEHDVLRDPLLTVLLDDGEARQGATLCEVLAWLSADRTLSFTALQPHQHHPWHAFLVQLAAIALDRAGRDRLPTRPKAWEQLLLALTEGAREPWCLVVDELDKPALLQPPVPEGTLDVLKKTISTPDALDILLTVRNFDVKGQRVITGAAEHWLLALVAKQTFEGYVIHYHGILRMNGAHANRPCVTFAPNSRWGARFIRDVRVWLEQRDELTEEYGYKTEGPALLWTLPWDGRTSRSPQGLHPFFVEVCRRIRLCQDERGLSARVGTSKKARLDATGIAGDTGDIWTPTRASSKGTVALTVGPNGFTYRLLQGLLFGDYAPPPALKLRVCDGDSPLLIATALVRGEGQTNGHHGRHIPIPSGARKMFMSAEGHQVLGERSRAQLNRAGEATQDVLRLALLELCHGVTKPELRRRRIRPWIDRLDARIDDRFFTELFEAATLDADAARIRWDRILVQLLKQTFDEALRETPVPKARRYRIAADAESRFWNALRKSFPEAIAPETTAEESVHA